MANFGDTWKLAKDIYASFSFDEEVTKRDIFVSLLAGEKVQQETHLEIIETSDGLKLNREVDESTWESVKHCFEHKLIRPSDEDNDAHFAWTTELDVTEELCEVLRIGDTQEQNSTLLDRRDTHYAWVIKPGMVKELCKILGIKDP